MSTIIGLVSTFRLPLQIHRACSSLLDFLMPSRSFNVQSATLARPFWTSAYLNSASTSNPPLLLIPFGLPRAVSPLQRPIHRVSTSPTKGVEFFAPLRSAQSRGPPDLVRPCPKPGYAMFYPLIRLPLVHRKGGEEAHASSLPFPMDQRGVEPFVKLLYSLILLASQCIILF